MMKLARRANQINGGQISSKKRGGGGVQPLVGSWDAVLVKGRQMWESHKIETDRKAASSSLSWTIMRESAVGIRKSHSCLIRIQYSELLLAILVFTFYFQKLHATCHMP